MTMLRFGLQDRLNQILSNSVKERALFKKKRFKKIEFEVSAGEERLLPSNLARHNLARHLELIQFPRIFLLGAFLPVYQKQVLKN